MVRLSSLFLCLLAGVSALAGNHCERCGDQCGSSRLVAKTIMVPTVITEIRMKTKIVKTMKEQEQTYTAFKKVPVTQRYEKESWYLEPDVKTQSITEKHCKHVKNQVIRNYAVKVPVQEIREGTTTRTICTECGEVCVEEPCSCQVTRLKTDIRTQEYCIDDVVFEEVKKDITYCIKTPKKHTEFCAEEITYKLEPVEKKCTVQVCVPEVVKCPVECQVVKMIPKVVYCCEKCSGHH